MLNQCMFVGNLGEDPESRYTKSGKQVVNFRIACSEKRGGQETTEWVSVVAWEQLADICAKYLKKGSRVFVSGRMQTRKYQANDGSDRYVTEIVANTMKMLDRREDRQSDDHGYPEPPPGYGGTGENFPF